MEIDLHSLEPDGIRFDTDVRIPPLPLGGDEHLDVLEAHVRGEAHKGSVGVDFDGRLRGRVRVNCSRCLEPLEVPVDVDFRLILVPDAVEFGREEAELDEQASLFFYAEGGKARLADIVREQIYLQLPLKPVCGPDCAGLCPTCGANRNRLKCGCRSEDVDPRLAPLLEFKKKLRQR